MPLGFSLFFLIFNFKKASKNKLLFVIIFLWTFSTSFVANFLWKLVEFPWKRLNEDLAPTADAIVVLGNNGRPKVFGRGVFYEWSDPDRVFAGIKLFQKRKASLLFFTGGAIPYSDSINEGILYRDYAISLGIPSEAIKTTARVFNTAQEAKTIKSYFKETKSTAKILLVTSAYHMQRAKKIFERQGFFVHPFPVDFRTSLISTWQSPYHWMPNSNNLNRSSQALREILGRTFYRSWSIKK